MVVLGIESRASRIQASPLVTELHPGLARPVFKGSLTKIWTLALLHRPSLIIRELFEDTENTDRSSQSSNYWKGMKLPQMTNI